MKSRQILTAGGLAILLCLVACSSGPKQVSVDITCADFGDNERISKEVELAVGGSLVVSLCNNAEISSTFLYKWSEEISHESVLRRTERKWEPPSGTSNPYGMEVWTFEALEAGKSYVSMQYLSPHADTVWTFILTVVVK